MVRRYVAVWQETTDFEPSLVRDGSNSFSRTFLSSLTGLWTTPLRPPAVETVGYFLSPYGLGTGPWKIA